MRTEIPFTLPRGLADEAGGVAPAGAVRLAAAPGASEARRGRGGGGVHRGGGMRLATARDEIEPLRDPEVRRNEAYLSVLLLARTVTRIGEVTEITPEVIEALYAADFDHLQRLYERVNTDGETVGVVHCPECSHEFEVDLTDIEDGRLGK